MFWLLKDGTLWHSAVLLLHEASISWLLAGVTVSLVGNFLGVLRWKIFLDALTLRTGFWKCFQLYFIGAFFNHILLGAVGGDAVKVGYLMAEKQNKSAALLSVVLDRISGFGALAITTITLTIWRYDWLIQSPIVSSLLLFVFAYLVVALFFLGLTFAGAASGRLHHLREDFPFRERVIELTDAYAVFVRCWRGSLVASGISFLILFSYFLTFYCASQAFHAGIGLLDFSALMPMVDVITALPVSLGGLGVREKLFDTLLGQLCGTEAAKAFLISMAGYLMTVMAGLPGMLFLPFYRGLTKKC